MNLIAASNIGRWINRLGLFLAFFAFWLAAPDYLGDERLKSMEEKLEKATTQVPRWLSFCVLVVTLCVSIFCFWWYPYTHGWYTDTRNVILEMTVLLSGNAVGITLHFMSHIDKLAQLDGIQIALLLLTSLLIAGAEAIQHGLPEGDERANFYKRMTQFFLSLLITIIISDKPQ